MDIVLNGHGTSVQDPLGSGQFAGKPTVNHLQLKTHISHKMVESLDFPRGKIFTCTEQSIDK